MEHAEKLALCQRLSTLQPDRAREVYTLISDYARVNATTLPRRLGSKNNLPFGAHQQDDGYQFQLELLPLGLLRDIERLLASE